MNNYEEYALLDAQIKDLENKKESLRVGILEDMIDKGVEKVETSVGKFTVSKLKKWTYTDKVTELNEKYKALKAKEESTGDATFEEVESLRFTGLKL